MRGWLDASSESAPLMPNNALDGQNTTPASKSIWRSVWYAVSGHKDTEHRDTEHKDLQKNNRPSPGKSERVME
jgi:hypothetical protein